MRVVNWHKTYSTVPPTWQGLNVFPCGRLPWIADKDSVSRSNSDGRQCRRRQKGAVESRSL